MTSPKTKVLLKLLSYWLIVTLTWGAVCGYKAFLGPGLSQAAALPAVEQLEESELVFPADNVNATASNTKYTNILVEVQISCGTLKA